MDNPRRSNSANLWIPWIVKMNFEKDKLLIMQGRFEDRENEPVMSYRRWPGLSWCVPAWGEVEDNAGTDNMNIIPIYVICITRQGSILPIVHHSFWLHILKCFTCFKGLSLLAVTLGHIQHWPLSIPGEEPSSQTLMLASSEPVSSDSTR